MITTPYCLKDMKDLKLDDEFQSYIPPYSQEEMDGILSIVREQGHYVFFAWNGFLLDSWDLFRYVFTNFDGKISCANVDLNDRFDAIAYICEMNLGRKDITEDQYISLLKTWYLARKEEFDFNKEQGTPLTAFREPSSEVFDAGAKFVVTHDKEIEELSSPVSAIYTAKLYVASLNCLAGSDEEQRKLLEEIGDVLGMDSIIMAAVSAPEEIPETIEALKEEYRKQKETII